MGHSHLHELLKQDQEPFHLKTFISDRRRSTALNLRNPKPIIESTSSSATARNFCINHVCLFSFQGSPEFTKSPFLDFPARELKSACNNNNINNNNNTAVFLHIPARTAAMLLDAAARVQKPKPGSKQIGLRLIGSFLRRLKYRSSRTKTREIAPVNATSSSPPTRRSRKKNGDGGFDKKRLSHSCDDRVSSGVWSEKSSEIESSCSSTSVLEFEDIECFCSSSFSPFRFSLDGSPSPARREPDPGLSAASPSRRFEQDKESYEVECQTKIDRQKDDEKEQCSPVSILDTLFDDDDEEERDGRATEQDYDIEYSYASVQKAKHQLLQKLQRFERLAGLDPIKLENYMLEQCYNKDKDEDATMSDQEDVMKDELFRDIANHLGVAKLPWYMKKLVFDLIEEENKNEELDVIVQRVCKRLHAWKVVELNTIDMMVEADFRSEGWKMCDEETVRDVGNDIEATIFGFMVEELAQDLVSYSSNYIDFKN